MNFFLILQVTTDSKVTSGKKMEILNNKLKEELLLQHKEEDEDEKGEDDI